MPFIIILPLNCITNQFILILEFRVKLYIIVNIQFVMLHICKTFTTHTGVESF